MQRLGKSLRTLEYGGIRLALFGAEDCKADTRNVFLCTIHFDRIQMRENSTNILLRNGEQLLRTYALAIEEKPVHHERHLPARERGAGIQMTVCIGRRHGARERIREIRHVPLVGIPHIRRQRIAVLLYRNRIHTVRIEENFKELSFGNSTDRLKCAIGVAAHPVQIERIADGLYVPCIPCDIGETVIDIREVPHIGDCAHDDGDRFRTVHPRVGSECSVGTPFHNSARFEIFYGFILLTCLGHVRKGLRRMCGKRDTEDDKKWKDPRIHGEQYSNASSHRSTTISSPSSALHART